MREALIIFALFLVGYTAWAILAVKNYKGEWIEDEDEDPFDGEWKDGDPNQPVPDDAKPISTWDPDDKTHYGDGGIS